MTVEAVHKQMEEMRDDFSKLSSDVKGVMQALIELGRSEAGEVGENLRNQAHKQMDQVKQAMDATRQRGEDTVESLGKKVKQHPLGTMLGALGVGFLLGALLDRRGNH